MFSNACHVLSQCNTRLRLFYLLSKFMIQNVFIRKMDFPWQFTYQYTIVIYFNYCYDLYWICSLVSIGVVINLLRNLCEKIVICELSFSENRKDIPFSIYRNMSYRKITPLYFGKMFWLTLEPSSVEKNWPEPSEWPHGHPRRPQVPRRHSNNSLETRIQHA